MNKTCFTLLLLITCIANTFSQILPYPISSKTLANGLQVVTIPYESPGVAAFYIVVRVGSRNEVEPGKTGFAHFFEHMMFRGTEKYSKSQYSEALKSTGASANANTSLDRTVYHMTGSAVHLEKMFELEADRFMNLKYSVQDFKTEAGAVKGEYTKNNANPLSRLYEAVNNTAFDVHPYKHTTMGFFEDIVDMPNQYDFSLEFFNKYYRPEYCTILVVGDVKHERVTALAEKYFGVWQRGNHVTDIPTEPEQKSTRFVHLTVPQFPPQLELKYKGPAFSLDVNDYHALSILSQMLFSEPSDLYQKLVVRDQDARHISGSIFPTRDPYLFSASVTLAKNEAMASVKKQIEAAIEKVKSEPVDAKKLQDTKERIRYSFALSMDSPDAIANAVALYLWVASDPDADALNKSFRMFDSVTAADIQRVAQKYLTPERLTIATISPEEKPQLD